MFPTNYIPEIPSNCPAGVYDNGGGYSACGILDAEQNYHATGLLTANCVYSSIPDQNICDVGLLKSFALRWAESTEAIVIIPFQRFVTGRIPNVSEYPFPYATVICGKPYNSGRSDRSEWYWRVVSLHVWVDADRLEQDGERAMEIARRIYNNESWVFNYGKVTDVTSAGFTTTEINIPEYHYWELIKTFNIRIEQARYDNCLTECPTCPSSESSSTSGSACCT
jgi:hypothetical protein